MHKFEIVNKGNKVAEILFYGYISSWGDNSSKSLSTRLRNLDKEYDKVIIKMNSGGGSVLEASAIYSALQSIEAEVQIDIEGIAASAASFILLAADKVRISKAGRIMLHKFSGSAWGNSDDLRDTADMMDKWEDDWIEIYAEKMGLTSKEVKDKYFQRGKNTWIGPKDALKLGIINEIIEGTVKAAPKNVDNMSVENAVLAYSNTLDSKEDTNSNSNTMNEDQLAAIGLPENATQEQIDARLKELANAEEKVKTLEAKKDQEESDKEKEDLKAKVEKMENEKKEELLNKAVADGKILATSKDSWMETINKVGLDSAEKMINELPGAVKPGDVVNKKNDSETKEYETLEDLNKEGIKAVEAYKSSNPEGFNALWKAEYGSDYAEEEGTK